MEKLIFRQIDWSWVDQGLEADASGRIEGTALVTDAVGERVPCQVSLQPQASTAGAEHINGKITAHTADGDDSAVLLQVCLEYAPQAGLAQLKFQLEETPPGIGEMSVALGYAAALAHWLTLAVARELRSGWLLQLEVPAGQSDRVTSRLFEELSLAAVMAADAVEDWACCLPPTAE